MVRLLFMILASLSLSLANWYVEVKGGFEAAKRENKLVALYFYSNYCPYCAQMEEFTLNQEEVQNKLKNFVVISLNISSDEGSKWARRLGVPGTPTIVFYDPKEEKALGALFGSRSRGEVINFINGVCKKANKVC